MSQIEPKFSLADRVVIPMWEKVDMHLGNDPLEVQNILRGLTSGERAIHSLMRCTGEILNGGFWQFFGNSSGILTYEAIQGLRLVGADKHAALVEKAVSRFPDGRVPLNWGERCTAMNSMIDSGTANTISELDAEFYALETQEPVGPYADRYIERNRKEFQID